MGPGMDEEEGMGGEPDMDNLTAVQLHTVTLQVQLQQGEQNPAEMDWGQVLGEMLPPARLRVLSVATDPQVYLVGEALEWATGDIAPAATEPPAMDPTLDQPMQQELIAAQANGGTGAHASDYGYVMVPPDKLKPYDPAKPHVLLPGQQFTLRRFTDYDDKQDTLVAGDTVWLYDVVPGHGFWRVYAAVTANGLCGYELSET